MRGGGGGGGGGGSCEGIDAESERWEEGRTEMGKEGCGYGKDILKTRMMDVLVGGLC